MAPTKKRGVASKAMTYHHHDNDDMDDEAFASDDEEIPDEFAKGDHLIWRKENSFSDWTIVIITATTTGVASSKPHEEEDDEEEASVKDDKAGGGDDEDDVASGNDDGKNKRGEKVIQQAFTYKVHKERLAIGPRRSGYFARLLKNGNNLLRSTRQHQSH
jgi:hypothetical protein